VTKPANDLGRARYDRHIAGRTTNAVASLGAALIRSPLTLNGYALVTSTVVASAFGLVFWIMAARLYTPEEVGLGAVLISTMVSLSAFAQLNLQNVLNRFVPIAGAGAGRLILLAYAAAASTAIVLSTIVVLAVAELVPRLGFLTSEPLMAVTFVAAVAVWTVFALQDSALASLREAIWVPLENTGYAVAKIVMLALLTGAAGAGIALFAAWVIPLVFIVGIINLLIFGKLLPRRRHTAVVESKPHLDVRMIARYLGWDYVGGVALTAAMGIAPLLVLSISGAEANASYHLAWTVTYSLYLIGRAMGVSLLTEGAMAPARLPSLTADTVIHTMLPLAGAALLVALSAPFLMSLFGSSYARDGALVLSVLAISSIPWGLVTIFLAVARARGWMPWVAVVQVATLTLVLGIGGALLPVLGPLGMAVAWLTAHVAVLCGITAVALTQGGPDRLTDWLLRLASAAARLKAALLAREPLRAGRGDVGGGIRSALQQMGYGDDGWRLRPASQPLSDSAAFFLERESTANGEPDRLIVKCALSYRGADSLARSREWQERLRRETSLADRGFDIPRILDERSIAGMLVMVEEAIAGEDGRSVLARPDRRSGALAAAANAIARLHRLTGQHVTVGEDWLADWVEGPVQMLRQVGGRGWHGDAWDAFLREQSSYWTHRALHLGITHGDYSPGNIIFTSGSEVASTPARIAGVIDWDQARLNGPAGFDICHLALTTHMLVVGEELGQAVRGLFDDAERGNEPPAWIRIGTGLENEWCRDRPGYRATVGLAWLHHLAAAVQKSERYAASRLWTASSVDWVLRSFAATPRRR
jgi:O-antigen/teichoic acid export membrane protein